MIKHTIDTEIRRRPEEVFEYLADVTKMTEWEPHTVRCQLQEGQSIGKGCQAIQTFKMFGRQSDVMLTMIEYEPNRSLCFEKQKPFSIRFGWTLEPVSGDTHVVYNAELEPKGIFRLVAVFMKSGIRKQIESDLTSIKRNLETGASDP